MPKFPGKKIPTTNNEVDLNVDTNIDAVQLAALNEDTERGSSKPGSIIHGQNLAGGSTSDHVLQPVKRDGESPYINNSIANQNIIEQLYTDHSALFNDRTINNIPVGNDAETVKKLKLATLGTSYQDAQPSIQLACFVPNLDSTTNTTWDNGSIRKEYRAFQTVH